MPSLLEPATLNQFLTQVQEDFNVEEIKWWIQGRRQMVRRNDRYLIKFNRVLVWLTLVLFIVFIISGYGVTNPELIRELTGGVFTRAISLNLHLKLAFPVLALLTIHVLIGAKSALTRWGVKQGRLLNVFLILLGIFAVTLLLLMQYFVL
jgi:hypothetical protein